jgi:hypothetical protein
MGALNLSPSLTKQRQSHAARFLGALNRIDHLDVRKYSTYCFRRKGRDELLPVAQCHLASDVDPAASRTSQPQQLAAAKPPLSPAQLTEVCVKDRPHKHSPWRNKCRLWNCLQLPSEKIAEVRNHNFSSYRERDIHSTLKKNTKQKKSTK